MEPNTEKNQQAEAQETAQETAKTALFVRLFRYDFLRQTKRPQQNLLNSRKPQQRKRNLQRKKISI